jgi:hypothetical protein
LLHRLGVNFHASSRLRDHLPLLDDEIGMLMVLFLIVILFYWSLIVGGPFTLVVRARFFLVEVLISSRVLRPLPLTSMTEISLIQPKFVDCVLAFIWRISRIVVSTFQCLPTFLGFNGFEFLCNSIEILFSIFNNFHLVCLFKKL